MPKDLPTTHEQAEALPTSLIADGPEVPPHHPIMDDIYGVGPEKPLGYLPLGTIRAYGENPDSVSDVSHQRGLSALSVSEEASSVNGGALYVYDEKALAHLLKTHRALLDRSGWPSEPADFVARIISETVDSKRQPELFTLVAWAFKDPRPEYQRPDPESITKQRSFMSRALGRLGLGTMHRQ